MDDEEKFNVDEDVNQTESTLVTGLYRFNFQFVNDVNCENIVRDYIGV